MAQFSGINYQRKFRKVLLLLHSKLNSRNTSLVNIKAAPAQITTIIETSLTITQTTTYKFPTPLAETEAGVTSMETATDQIVAIAIDQTSAIKELTALLYLDGTNNLVTKNLLE